VGSHQPWHSSRDHHHPYLPAGSGTIDVRELKAALEAMGQHPSDEEIFVMVHDVSSHGLLAGKG
jgi:Ca2+-binding EF-hand superfamily protein